MGGAEEQKRKNQIINHFKDQMNSRSWSLEFKDKTPPGAEDEIAKVRDPGSKLRVCFHLTSEFLLYPVQDWEGRISEAIAKAESLFTENKDCEETVKLILRSSEPFLMEPPSPCPGSGV